MEVESDNHSSRNSHTEKLPQVRFPGDYSVPDHLFEEFNNLYPNAPIKKRKGKFNLHPAQKLTGREREFIHASWMIRFWNPEKLDIITRILLHQSPVTLSLLDWLCTNYAKNKDIHYPLNENDPSDFYIYEDYNKNLDDFCRPCFDSFSRNQRILLEYVCKSDVISVPENAQPSTISWDTKNLVGVRLKDGQKLVYLITSVGQLIFFWWAIQYRVIEYCEQHMDEIREHMMEGRQQPVPKNGKRRKLTEQAQKSWFVKSVSIVMNYDVVNSLTQNQDSKNDDE